MPRPVPFVVFSLALCGALLCPRAEAAVMLLRVGGDAACDYRTDVHPNALQQAINAVPTSIPPGDAYVIRVARSGSYSGVKYVLNDRSVIIEGGFATCSSSSPGSDNTEIDGTGAPSAPMLYINGGTVRRDVRLQRITLKNGSDGGLNVRAADVSLERVSLADNTALNGGGLRIDGAAPGALVQLDGASSVTGNTADHGGGGIYCNTGAALVLHSNSAVSRNTAAGNGGGIYIDGCEAEINSGAEGLPALFVNIGFNEAAYGGGIAVNNGGRLRVGQYLSGTDPRPLIVNNTATYAGGGIFARAEGTQVGLYDAVVAGNQVTNGAGSGGGVAAGEGAFVGIIRTKPRCNVEHCSRISGNSAARGGAITVGNGAEVMVVGTRIEGNTATLGGSAYLAARDSAVVRSANNVIVGNTGPSVAEISPHAYAAPRQAAVQFFGDTLANNPDATRVVSANADGLVSFGRTLVNAAAAVPVVACTPSEPNPICVTQVTMHCNVFHSQVNVGHYDELTSFSTAPGFVNAAAGNYRLHPGGHSVDRCPEHTSYPYYDHELSPRPYDAPIGNIAGPFDVGAYEWNPILFHDGFED